MNESRVSKRNVKIDTFINNVQNVIVGKRNVIELIVAAMLADGHVLIEDVPGVGKTQMVSAIAKSCGGEFGRISLTPDVMPSDITGFMMFNNATREFEFKKGAVFCNFLLVDEINRTSPKAQSALLEVMEEYQVSIDGNTYKMPHPFMVLATQNPVEIYGTYHLPEAQMDRFMIKVKIGYPEKYDEIDILEKNENKKQAKDLESVMTCEEIIEMRQEVKNIHCSEEIKSYIIDIVNETRKTDYVRLPISPRGSIALYKMSKAFAYIRGMQYVTPDVVKLMATYVLSHRLLLTSRGKSMFDSNEDAVNDILSRVVVPLMK